jgi:threonine synthase
MDENDEADEGGDVGEADARDGVRFSDAFERLECAETGTAYDRTATGRSEAGAPLVPRYDLDGVLTRELVDGAASLWDLAPALPFAREAAVEAAEGATPLVETPSLAEEFGVGRVAVKDESRNPTGTVYDRGLSLAATSAAERGAELVALAAAGNAGQSAAAYAGAAGLRSYAFVPSRAPFPNKAMVNVHGGEMRVVGGRYPDALAAVDDQLESAYHSLQEFADPFRHDAYRSLAYELLADLDWRVPDAVVLPVGTGEVVVGVVAGLRDCADAGLVDGVPRVYAAQAAGCAPVVTAFEADRSVEPWSTPDTIVGELEIPDPPGGDLAVAALRETGGGAVAVDDDEALEAAVTVAATAVLEVGAAGGVAVAGAGALAADGAFDDDATVVVANTESGTKTADVLRSHLMGKGI